MAVSWNDAELFWSLWRMPDYYGAYDVVQAYADLLDAREEAILDLDEFVEEHTGESLGWSLSFIFAYLFGEGVGSWSGEIDFDSAMITLGFHPSSHSYRHFRELTENLMVMLEANESIENELVKLQAVYLETEDALRRFEEDFLDAIAERWNNLEQHIAESDEKYEKYPTLAIKTRYAESIARLDRLLFGKRDIDRDELLEIIVTAPDERGSMSRWEHPSLATTEEVLTHMADRQLPERHWDRTV